VYKRQDAIQTSVTNARKCVEDDDEYEDDTR